METTGGRCCLLLAMTTFRHWSSGGTCHPEPPMRSVARAFSTLDIAGNACVEFSNVLIDVRGRRRPMDARRPDPVSGNLFSRGRAQVIFALLAWPQLWDEPQRGLARAAGVSLGQAHNTLALLAEAGYDGVGPRRGQTALLHLWAAAFPIGPARHLTLATYRGE